MSDGIYFSSLAILKTSDEILFPTDKIGDNSEENQEKVREFLEKFANTSQVCRRNDFEPTQKTLVSSQFVPNSDQNSPCILTQSEAFSLNKSLYRGVLVLNKGDVNMVSGIDNLSAKVHYKLYCVAPLLEPQIIVWVEQKVEKLHFICSECCPYWLGVLMHNKEKWRKVLTIPQKMLIFANKPTKYSNCLSKHLYASTTT